MSRRVGSFNRSTESNWGDFLRKPARLYGGQKRITHFNRANGDIAGMRLLKWTSKSWQKWWKTMKTWNGRNEDLDRIVGLYLSQRKKIVERFRLWRTRTCHFCWLKELPWLENESLLKMQGVLEVNETRAGICLWNFSDELFRNHTVLWLFMLIWKYKSFKVSRS